tara:strand:- start:234 stop:530 length:297 start_codon:yes stop_codon:yes gene_type:complete
MIEAPEVWLAFGMCIYQDFFSVHSEFYEGILFALEGLNNSEKHELLTFVRDTLRENPTNQYLVDLWGKSGASDILVSEQMKVVYEVLQSAIEASIQKE